MIQTYARPIQILLIEDSPSDAHLTLKALSLAKVANKVSHVEDGVGAMEFLNAKALMRKRRDPILCFWI